MSTDKIQEILDSMGPEEAASAIATALKKLFALLEEDARLQFVLNLLGEPSDEKLTSLVHLGLATCMDEGVDPKHMCQNLMDRVAQSEQLMAVADPQVLVVFEDWLEEMEEEVVAFVKKTGSMNANDLADGLGLSRSGSTFLITKLKREGKL